MNARFTNTIVPDKTDPTRWLVGTEGGVLVGEGNGDTWSETSLNDTPVRALVQTDGLWLAGSDGRGIQSSPDGVSWVSLGDIDRPVFDVVVADGVVIGATDQGVVIVNENGDVVRKGPRTLFRCLAVDPEDPRRWLAGADPGGIWWTEDSGDTWHNNSAAIRVRHILAPERGDA